VVTAAIMVLMTLRSVWTVSEISMAFERACAPPAALRLLGIALLCLRRRALPEAHIRALGAHRISETVHLHAVARARPEDRALLETRIDSILFWGVFAAILGLLGTLGGLAQMAGAIEAAGTVNPALLWGGVRVALSTTIAGTAVLGVALPVWYLLRRRWLAPT
jgi:hypothetical protein